MHLSSLLLLGIHLSTVLSLPTTLDARSDLSTSPSFLKIRSEVGAAKEVAAGTEAATKVTKEKATETATAGKGKASETAEAGAGAGEEAEAGEGEEGEEATVDKAGVFETAVALEGGDAKQDVLFTASAIGAFEFEFQNDVADSLTVTENKTPAAPPTGFVAIEPSSFQVSLATSKGAGLTLSKIDYIFDAANADLAAMDLTQAQVGKLCTETNTFTIGEALGELEFEAEENEVTLNLNKAVLAEGEWGIFLPSAAAGAEGAAGNGTATETGKAKETKAAETKAGEKAKATATATKTATAGEATATQESNGSSLSELLAGLLTGQLG